MKKVPVKYIISQLKNDDDLQKYCSDEDIAFIISEINKLKFPKYVKKPTNLLEKVYIVIDIYFDKQSWYLQLFKPQIKIVVKNKIAKVIKNYNKN